MRLCFAKRPKGRSIFASPVGALCEKSPRNRPKESRCANGRGAAAFWGLYRLTNASTIPLTPAPRGFARLSPQRGRIMRCPSARGSPFKVVARPRFSASRLERIFREQGATRAAKPPKTERGGFRSSGLAEKLPRSVSRLRRALRPYSMKGTMPRTINRRHRRIIPPRAASATLRLFSRQVGSPRTLQGLSVWGARIFPRVRGTSGTRPRTMTGRGAARSGLRSAAGR